MITSKLAVALVVLSHCALLGAKENNVPRDMHIVDGLDLKVPEHVDVKKGSPADDFDISCVLCREGANPDAVRWECAPLPRRGM